MQPRKLINYLLALGAFLSLAACSPGDLGRGDLHLPQGDSASGKELFVSLGCVGCHVVARADLPEPAEERAIRVVLGSQAGGMSYGQLVTAVVNPSHRLSRRYRADEVSVDGESIMASYNDVITVTQLTDLVAFLEMHYQVAERPGYKYPSYKYGADDKGDDSAKEQ